MADEIIPITRPSLASAVPPPTPRTDTKFPTEVIYLPSKGWFYPSDYPLSNGTLELKMMTAKEEDILNSKNLINKNIVLDKLLESVVIDKRVNLDDMFTCDRNAAFFAIRRLAYGDAYDVTISCGRCGKENSVTIDLSKMNERPFDFDQYPRGENSFRFTLPYGDGDVLTYKILTKKDERAIEQELKGLEKVSKDFTKEVTTRLCHVITAVNGNSEKGCIRKFVNEGFLSKNSLAFRKHLRENMPDIDDTFDFYCQHCGLERKESTPVGVNFFWPNG
jgi:transcription elongation factor Elf1